LTRLPRSDWGKALSHAGLGVILFAISGLYAWQVEDIRVALVGEPFDVGAYTLVLNDVRELDGPNYFSTMGDV
jgi:cytochrome c-type biogenesis protein CcmF